MSDGKIERDVSISGQGQDSIETERLTRDLQTKAGPRTIRDEVVRNGKDGIEGTTETISVNWRMTDQQKKDGAEPVAIHSLTLINDQQAMYDGKPMAELTSNERAQAAALEAMVHRAFNNYTVQTGMQTVGHEEKTPSAPAKAPQPTGGRSV